MKTQNIREETRKNKLRDDYFSKFDCTDIIGNIDFAVKVKRDNVRHCGLDPQSPNKSGDSAFQRNDGEEVYLLWAEAKKDKEDIIAMLAQLVLTIGKARTFDKILPPPFLGCFDSEKIAFIPYSEIQDIFYQNDFNWNVAPSNTETKEFKQVYEKIKSIIENDIPFETYLFYFERDEKDLRRFIRENFVVGKGKTTKIKIDKNNFINVFNRWLDVVKPTIGVDWNIAKKNNILDCDFYLADLLSSNNKTIHEKLNVLLKTDYYKYNKQEDILGAMFHDAYFSDNQKAYNLFWAKYERPPHEDYRNFIIDRRPLLVPQDVREVKGSFFTPPEWVELSQEYLAKTFGENWQDEYYVWDCAAGTGNLLTGLINKDNLWASTLDKQDVDVMKQRIENGANLWAEQVFQFDFLNDDFLPKSNGGKLPDELYYIISDEKKRKKLLIYINPPYAEATTSRTTTGTGANKATVATKHKTKDKYKSLIGAATNEISAHFMARIYNEIPLCKLATFSTFKFVCTQNFIKFRKFFKADFKDGFAVHADTFDNVKGKFPIGFTIWDLDCKKFPEFIEVDVPEENTKKKYYNGFHRYINQWLKQFDETDIKYSIGFMCNPGADFQNVNQPYIENKKGTRHFKYFSFSVNNLIEGCIYFAVRLCIKSTWLNNRDQFYFPNDNWKNDIEFQNNCLTFTLFHSQNKITVKDGVNHWIPFVETEVNAKYKFESHTMTNFISGDRKQNGYTNLFENAKETEGIEHEFSKEAQAVFDAGRELWKLYHKQPKINVNASLYDIKEYFKGRNEKGAVNQKSTNPEFNILDKELTAKLNILAKKIEPKVYEYEFLKK